MRTPRTADVVLVLAVGLGVGALTSCGQAYLGGVLSAFVNSASAWLVAPFLVGARMRSGREAAVAGLAVCGLQVAGYFVTAELRGYPSGDAALALWTACAIVGGPVFGVAGRLWRRATGDLRGVGAAVLPAAFLAEGAWTYWHELHDDGTAALWVAIGAFLAVALTRGRRELRWVVPALGLGLVAEMVLTVASTTPPF